MKRGTCQLCQEEADLAHGHVFPEFFYTPTYDEGGSFLSVTSHPHHPIRPFQKGEREYILCLDCEAKFSRLETYVADLLREPYSHKVPMQKCIQLANVDYAKYKLFCMSVIWRAHVSSRHTFSSVDLGIHAEKIRRMLVSERPGEPHEYGTALIKIRGSEAADTSIQSPIKKRFNGVWAYRYLALGFYWVTAVSRGSARLAAAVPFPSKGGNLVIPIIDRSERAFLLMMRRSMEAMGKL